MKLTVNEIVYSIQGEGRNAGQPMLFIRLAFCNLNCWFCDTPWDTGTPMDLESILKELQKYPQCKKISWCGGEPTMQLTQPVVQYFTQHGYWQSIETNGTNNVPPGLDYVVCSPKTQYGAGNWLIMPHKANELRFPIQDGEPLPQVPQHTVQRLGAELFLSPIFTGAPKENNDLNTPNMRHCIELVMANPEWNLSIQQHKLWGIK